jgi:hypothetical protein
MSQFIRLPWLIGGPSLTTRGALTTLLSLDTSVQSKIRNAIGEVGWPFNRKKLTNQAQRLHDELKVVDADTLFNIMDALTDLVGIPDNELSSILADIFKDTGIPFAGLESLIREMASDPAYTKQRAIEEFKHQALPFLRGLEHFCAIRTRFDKPFLYNEDNIESYNPKVVDHHPVVVLRIGLDDHTKNFSFQLDQEGLDKLISELIAAQKQLKVAADELARVRNDGK